MAHVQKFARGSAGRIIGHCEREKNEDGYLKYKTTSDIDVTKTRLNMQMLFSDGLTGHERLAKRLDEVFVLNRKDVNVMCDWVITYPKGLPQDSSSLVKFFNQVADFLQKRYGQENVVSCNVHRDEASPHMHYCFVPVVYDKKKNRKKVSAKEVLNKTDLNTFHQDLEDYLHETIGLEKGTILSGVTKAQGGNKTITELKTAERDKNLLAFLKKNLKILYKIARTYPQMAPGIDDRVTCMKELEQLLKTGYKKELGLVRKNRAR